MTIWLLWEWGRFRQTGYCGREGQFDNLVIVGVLREFENLVVVGEEESVKNWLL
jgi:hypothetical protein